MAHNSLGEATAMLETDTDVFPAPSVTPNLGLPDSEVPFCIGR